MRRRVIELLFTAGFERLPAVAAMPDRLAAYVLAHVAQGIEEEKLVFWKGDITGELADGSVVVNWPEFNRTPAGQMAPRILHSVQDALERRRQYRQAIRSNGGLSNSCFHLGLFFCHL